MRAAEDLATRLLRQGTSLKIKAHGGSMLPFLLDGDVVLVSPVSPGGLRVGDVVCYESPPGGILLHRVIARRADGVLARGDALTYTERVNAERVLGRAVAVERRGALRRLDRGPLRWLGRLLVVLSPLIARLLPLALQARRAVRAVLRG